MIEGHSCILDYQKLSPKLKGSRLGLVGRGKKTGISLPQLDTSINSFSARARFMISLEFDFIYKCNTMLCVLGFESDILSRLIGNISFKSRGDIGKHL